MMNKTSVFTALALFTGMLNLLIFQSCDKSVQTGPSSGSSLHFSASSVSFDTVFTSLISTYRTLTLYNDQAEAMLIPSLSLKGDHTGKSMFIFSAGGNKGPLIKGLRINGKDSLVLYIKVLVSPDQHIAPFLVQDSLLLNTGNKVISVPIHTYAQNIQRVTDTLISASTDWNALLPYLIEHSLTIRRGASLRIAAGTRIYFLAGTGLTVNGSLLVNGTRLAPVYFNAERLEAIYNGIPGQWKGIQVNAGSSGNLLNFTVIKDAYTGIFLNSSVATENIQTRILNSRISNMTYDGINSKNSGLKVLNSLIYNCGNKLFEFQGDAPVQIEQSTFYNSSDFSFHTLSSLDLAFTGKKDSLIFLNNIVYGNLPEEMSLSGGQVLSIAGNLIQSALLSKTFPLNIFSKDPLFRNSAGEDFHLGSAASAAYQAGVKIQSSIDSPVLKTDPDNKIRRTPPSAGCYEF